MSWFAPPLRVLLFVLTLVGVAPAIAGAAEVTFVLAIANGHVSASMQLIRVKQNDMVRRTAGEPSQCARLRPALRPADPAVILPGRHRRGGGGVIHHRRVVRARGAACGNPSTRQSLRLSARASAGATRVVGAENH